MKYLLILAICAACSTPGKYIENNTDCKERKVRGEWVGFSMDKKGNECAIILKCKNQ